MKNRLVKIALLFFFSFMLIASAEAILLPPHRVGGLVTVTGGGTLDDCTAILSSGASESVVDGSYLFNVPIYDPVDNPTGISVGSMVTVSIEKDDLTLALDSFIVEVGGLTPINFTVNIASETIAYVEGDEFITVRAAYENALDGDTIFIKGESCVGIIQENLVFDRPDGPSLEIVGGCDCDFIPSNDLTAISSSLTIVSGTIVVESLVLQ